ncbi:MAG TPA: hypothetical protein VF007_04485 [Stellaceae bacterium]
MHRQVGLLGIAGIFGLQAVALAQVPSPARAPFDGTYQVVSSTSANQTYVQRGGQMGFCPPATPGPLTIAQNRLSYTTESGRRLDGTVGPNGEIQIQYSAPTTYQPVRVNVRGSVDGSGAVRVRQEGNSCSYDIVWQRR